MDLNGRRVLITGASKGIGAEIARAMAGAGADVALAARSADALSALADDLGGRAYPIDLADPTRVDGFVARVEADGGPVDVLVNNAGIETGDTVETHDEAEMATVAQVNLVVPMQLSRQALPGMIERDRGHIVNVSSAAAMLPVPGLSVYCATKAGLSHFTAALQTELKNTEVGLTTCTLGPVDTEMWDRAVANPYFDAAQRRFRRIGLIADVPPETVAAEVVKAVQKRRRHVRLPRRIAPSASLGELNRRICNVMYSGLKVKR